MYFQNIQSISPEVPIMYPVFAFIRIKKMV